MTGERREASVPAMVNAHSHAFQRDLRGRAERRVRGRRLLELAGRDVSPGRLARSRVDARGGRAGLSGDGGGGLRGRGRVPLRAPRAGRAALRRSERARDRRGRGRPGGGAHRGPAPGGLPPGGLGRRSPRAGPRPAPLLRSVGGGLSRAGGRAARLGRRAAAGCGWAWRRTAFGRCRPSGSPRSRATPTSTASFVTCTRPSSAGSSRSAAPSTAARRSSCSSEPASWASGRAWCTASTSRTPTSATWPGAGPSWCPAPPPRATSATATCRRFATATPGSGWRWAATRRSASTPSRRCASSRPAPAARGRRAWPCWPAAGDLWGDLARNGAASLGLSEADARRVVVDRDHPDLRGIADDDLPAALATCASAGVVVRLD